MFSLLASFNVPLAKPSLSSMPRICRRMRQAVWQFQVRITRLLGKQGGWDTARGKWRCCRKFDDVEGIVYDRTAGWSSLVARWAHNPKVGGSNPPPATILNLQIIDNSWDSVSRLNERSAELSETESPPQCVAVGQFRVLAFTVNARRART